MKLDIHNPVWIAKREKLWEEQSQRMSEVYSAKQLAQIKPMFFEDHFDYGNEKKYGEFSTDFLKAFSLCPIQTIDTWTLWFGSYLPNWLGSRYTDNIIHYIDVLAYKKESRILSGWNREEVQGLFKFCYGEEIILGPYQFLDYQLDRHPFMHETLCTQFYSDWINGIGKWLRGVSSEPDDFNVERLNMWFSTISWVNPIFFSHPLLFAINKEQAALQELLVYCRDGYSIEKVLKNRRSVLDKDTGKREQFVKLFLDKFEALQKPEELELLWQLSQKADFIPAHKMKPELESKTYTRPRLIQITQWTKERIEEEKVKL